MPRLAVHYVGLLQRLAGTAEEEFELPPAATVRDLIGAMAARHGVDVARALTTTAGRLREGAWVLVGGESVRDGRGLDTVLDGATDVSVLIGIYPVAGGADPVGPRWANR